MGSPFSSFATSRVNVIRSAIGMRKLVNSLLFATNEWMSDDLVDDLLIEVQIIVEGADLPSYQHTFLREYVEGKLWEICHSRDYWSTFGAALMGLIADYGIARFYKQRLVTMVITNYTSDLSPGVDRAVVLDFTKRETSS